MTSVKFFLRAIGITFLRFFTLAVLFIFVQNFEVSPLPEWTLAAFAYIMQFLITYAFAHWAFLGREPRVMDAAYVAALFVLLGSALEGWVFLALTRGTIQDLLRNYNAISLFLVILYVAAVLLAAYDAKRKSVHRSLGEGLES